MMGQRMGSPRAAHGESGRRPPPPPTRATWPTGRERQPRWGASGRRTLPGSDVGNGWRRATRAAPRAPPRRTHCASVHHARVSGGAGVAGADCAEGAGQEFVRGNEWMQPHKIRTGRRLRRRGARLDLDVRRRQPRPRFDVAERRGPEDPSRPMFALGQLLVKRMTGVADGAPGTGHC